MNKKRFIDAIQNKIASDKNSFADRFSAQLETPVDPLDRSSGAEFRRRWQAGEVRPLQPIADKILPETVPAKEEKISTPPAEEEKIPHPLEGEAEKYTGRYAAAPERKPVVGDVHPGMGQQDITDRQAVAMDTILGLGSGIVGYGVGAMAALARNMQALSPLTPQMTSEQARLIYGEGAEGLVLNQEKEQDIVADSYRILKEIPEMLAYEPTQPGAKRAMEFFHVLMKPIENVARWAEYEAAIPYASAEREAAGPVTMTDVGVAIINGEINPEQIPQTKYGLIARLFTEVLAAEAGFRTIAKGIKVTKKGVGKATELVELETVVKPSETIKKDPMKYRKKDKRERLKVEQEESIVEDRSKVKVDDYETRAERQFLETVGREVPEPTITKTVADNVKANKSAKATLLDMGMDAAAKKGSLFDGTVSKGGDLSTTRKPRPKNEAPLFLDNGVAGKTVYNVDGTVTITIPEGINKPLSITGESLLPLIKEANEFYGIENRRGTVPQKRVQSNQAIVEQMQTTSKTPGESLPEIPSYVKDKIEGNVVKSEVVVEGPNKIHKIETKTQTGPIKKNYYVEGDKGFWLPVKDLMEGQAILQSRIKKGRRIIEPPTTEVITKAKKIEVPESIKESLPEGMYLSKTRREGGLALHTFEKTVGKGVMKKRFVEYAGGFWSEAKTLKQGLKDLRKGNGKLINEGFSGSKVYKRGSEYFFMDHVNNVTKTASKGVAEELLNAHNTLHSKKRIHELYEKGLEDAKFLKNNGASEAALKNASKSSKAFKEAVDIEVRAASEQLKEQFQQEVIARGESLEHITDKAVAKMLRKIIRESDPATRAELSVLGLEKLIYVPGLYEFNQWLRGVKKKFTELPMQSIAKAADNAGVDMATYMRSKGASDLDIQMVYERSIDPNWAGRKQTDLSVISDHPIEGIAWEKAAKLTDDNVLITEQVITNSDAFGIRNMRSLGDVVNIPEAFFALFETPNTTFRKLGAWAYENIYRRAQNMDDAIRIKRESTINKINKMAKGLTKKDLKEVGEYAIWKQGSEGRAILESMGIKDVMDISGNPRLNGFYSEMRKMFDEQFTILNDARTVSGLEPIAKQKDYFTFAASQQWLEKNHNFHVNLGRASSDFMVSNMRDVAKSNFKWAQKRRAHARPEVELNAKKVLETYMINAIRHAEYAPFTNWIKNLVSADILNPRTGTKGSMQQYKPIAAQFLTDWINHANGITKPSFDVGGGRLRTAVHHMDKGLRKLNENLAYSYLSWSMRTVVAQSAALRGTLQTIGMLDTIRASAEVMNPRIWNEVKSTSKVIKGVQLDAALTDIMRAPTKTKVGAGVRAVGQAGMKIMQFIDGVARVITWRGAYNKFTRGGYSKKAAIRMADDVVTRTQGSAAAIDLSPIQRIQAGKTATIFQTFVINDLNFILYDVMGIGKKYKSKAAGIADAAKFTMYSTVIAMLYEDMLNIHAPFGSPMHAIKKANEEEYSLGRTASEVFSQLADYIPIINSSRYGSIGGAAAQAVQDLWQGSFKGEFKKAGTAAARISGLPVSTVTRFQKGKEEDLPFINWFLGR